MHSLKNNTLIYNFVIKEIPIFLIFFCLKLFSLGILASSMRYLIRLATLMCIKRHTLLEFSWIDQAQINLSALIATSSHENLMI